MKPIRLEPVYKKTIWADNYLSQLRNLDEKIGIAREVCAYKGSENNVLSPEFAGLKISDVIKTHHEELMGDDPNDQLIRCAYMSSAEDLSIQVHMNEEQAQKVGDYEKSEAWYVLRSGEDGSVVVGVNTNDKEVLKQAIQNNELEKYLIRKPVQEGDFVMVPANLIHANGKDLLVLEIGSYGGITYRLYDYGRGRDLDLDKGLEVSDTTLRSQINHFPIPEKFENRISVGVHHHLFHTDVVDVEEEMLLTNENNYSIVTCVKNECTIECEGEEYRLRYTETILLPASIEEYIIKGTCRVLRSYKSK